MSYWYAGERSVLTASFVLVYMGGRSVCGQPCRPAGVQQWHRKQHWATADLSGELGTGRFDWHAPVCMDAPVKTWTCVRTSQVRTSDLILGRTVLELEGDSLWDADTDGGGHDTVPANLPLCSVFYHSAKPACSETGPRGRQQKRRSQAITEDNNTVWVGVSNL